MNHKSIIIATTLALAGLTACNPVSPVVSNIVTPAAPATTTTTTLPECEEGFTLITDASGPHCVDTSGWPVQVATDRLPDQTPVPNPITPAWANEHCPELLSHSLRPDLGTIATYCPKVLQAWILNAWWTTV